jgi:hypothetical protein
MNIQIATPYRLKVQINNDFGNPITGGTFAVMLKRNADDLYWDGDSWEAAVVSGLDLTHDAFGSWYSIIPGTAFTEEGQYTAIFDSATPNITDSFDLNVTRMAEQWSSHAE